MKDLFLRTLERIASKTYGGSWIATSDQDMSLAPAPRRTKVEGEGCGGIYRSSSGRYEIAYRVKGKLKWFSCPDAWQMQDVKGYRDQLRGDAKKAKEEKHHARATQVLPAWRDPNVPHEGMVFYGGRWSSRKSATSEQERKRRQEETKKKAKRDQLATDPMIRRTLMSDEQRRIDQKVVKLLQKTQSTTEEESQELRNKALYLVQKYDITIVKKEVLEWLHQPTTSAETPNMQLDRPSLPSSASSLGE